MFRSGLSGSRLDSSAARNRRRGLVSARRPSLVEKLERLQKIWRKNYDQPTKTQWQVLPILTHSHTRTHAIGVALAFLGIHIPSHLTGPCQLASINLSPTTGGSGTIGFTSHMDMASDILTFRLNLCIAFTSKLSKPYIKYPNTPSVEKVPEPTWAPFQAPQGLEICQ